MGGCLRQVTGDSNHYLPYLLYQQVQDKETPGLHISHAFSKHGEPLTVPLQPLSMSVLS